KHQEVAQCWTKRERDVDNDGDDSATHFDARLPDPGSEASIVGNIKCGETSGTEADSARVEQERGCIPGGAELQGDERSDAEQPRKPQRSCAQDEGTCERPQQIELLFDRE